MDDVKCKWCYNRIIFIARDNQWANPQDPWGYSCPLSDYGHKPDDKETTG